MEAQDSMLQLYNNVTKEPLGTFNNAKSSKFQF